MKKNTVIIGLGTMGTPMALRLLKKGFPLLVYDLLEERVQHLVAAGAMPAASAREAAAAAELIISMLPRPADTEALVLGENGIIPVLGEGKIFIDMSTSSPALTRRLCHEIETKGGRMLDAPVSGGHNKAIKGKLTIMVGGLQQVFRQCSKLFHTLGDKVHYVGGTGNGHLFKLLNNLLYAANMCAAAEILTLGEKLGADMARMVEVFNEASAASYCLAHKMQAFVLPGNFTPGLSTSLLLKDLELALELGEDAMCMQMFGKTAHQFFRIASDSGLEAEDNSAVIKVFRLLTNRDREN